MARTAPQTKAKRSYRQLADQYLICRTFLHAWDDVTGLDGVEVPPSHEPMGARIVLRCLRCDTIRYDTVSIINGLLLSRGYKYPEGYHLAPYDGEYTLRQEMRFEYLSRRK